MRITFRFLLLVFLGLILLKPMEAGAIAYRDVRSDYKHFDAIIALADRGVINGYTDGSFRPEQMINRAEALKILIEDNFPPSEIAKALDDHWAKNHSYVNVPDVKMTDWFGPHVELAFKNNIINGYTDNTFKPTHSINFAEGLKIILKTYNINVSTIDFAPSPLFYVKQKDWFALYFTYAREKNLINVNKFYHPAQPMTRGEFVEIIYRLNRIKNGGFMPFNPRELVVSDEYTVTIPRLNIINQKAGFADPYNDVSALKLLDRFAFGHYLSSPGSGRKFVLYGHSWGYDWYRSPYKTLLQNIDQLQMGDIIYINYREKGYAYKIYKNGIIPEKEINMIMENPEKNELILYTCWPLQTTKNRYIIYAKPV